MMEQRYVKPTATHVAAELLDKKPGVRVPILTREEAQNHKVMLNEKEVLHSPSAVLVWAAHAGYCLSLLALVVLSPLMLIIMAAIYIDDPHASPVFSQPRVGRGGRVFKFYKFRSMRANAEDMLKDLLKDNEMDGPVFKMANDPRITRVGSFIRKTSLDELAQLVNVLKGDMSIVGPRPPLPREVEQYDAYTFQRLYVTPGLSCYWQIQPHRNELSFEEWVDLDIKYIRERSFITDWKIIFRTVAVMLTRQGE
ncbi:MAG: sugar transferase [Christensenellales bacterium]